MATWALSIATLNRHDALMRCIRYALLQTRLPAEIVIVDASDNWEEGRAGAEAEMSEHPGIRLNYVQSPVRSSSEQRNIAVRESTADVVFLIDDDSFMHEDCAEEVMRVYEAGGDDVAGVAIRDVPEMPGGLPDEGLERKAGRGPGKRHLRDMVLRSRFGAWVNRKVLLQNVRELFLLYDEPRDRALPPSLEGHDVVAIPLMGGCVMTARRNVALAEPFDSSLRYYAAFEDLDVSYRYERHGLVLQAPRARLHHFEIAGGRIKRKKVIVFQLLNLLVFLKRHANPPERYLWRYRVLILRRLMGEALKDVASGRWSLPQASGALLALRKWREIWRKDTEDLDEWYPGFQKMLIESFE